MEAEFWHERWREGRIGFHQPDYNPQMVSCWPSLADEAGLGEGSTVFVPLAGKSRDMIWLAEQGYRVLGIELDKSAVDAFSAENAPVPGSIDLRCGDFFALTAEDLAEVAAVYDRAALIALPPEMRARYATHMRACLPKGTPMLILTLEYDQSEMDGPPFSVSEAEIRSLYGGDYSVECIDSMDLTSAIESQLPGRGLSALWGRAYHLRAL